MIAVYVSVLIVAGLGFVVGVDTGAPRTDLLTLVATILLAGLGLQFSVWTHRQERRGKPRIRARLSSIEARSVILDYQRAIQRAEKEAEEYRATVGWLNAWIEARERGGGNPRCNGPPPPGPKPSPPGPPPPKMAEKLR